MWMTQEFVNTSKRLNCLRIYDRYNIRYFVCLLAIFIEIKVDLHFDSTAYVYGNIVVYLNLVTSLKGSEIPDSGR